MRVAAILCPLDEVPVDFLADPDGTWEFETLAQAAGFEEAWGQISIGALTESYRGFPDGAAVVLLSTPTDSAIALVDCTVSRRERVVLGEYSHLAGAVPASVAA